MKSPNSASVRESKCDGKSSEMVRLSEKDRERMRDKERAKV